MKRKVLKHKLGKCHWVSVKLPDKTKKSSLSTKKNAIDKPTGSPYQPENSPNQRCNPIAIDEDKPETSNRSEVLNTLKENATDKPTGSPNQSENPPNQRRNPIDVAILGDSMIKLINPSKLRKSLKRNVMVKARKIPKT